MANKKAWEALKADPVMKQKSAKITLDNPTVDSFMDVHWGQAKPYNRYAPNCASQDEAHEKRAPAGCVALAMSQVMKYYNWPTRGIGQKYYTNTGYIKSDFCSDFSLPYSWDQITARYNQAHIPDTDLGKQAVGKLVFDTGIGVNMNFTCEDASAGFAFYTFSKQLLYGNTENIEKTDLTTARETILKLQPVLLGIPGHAVVIDGYSKENETEYFHINYGWGDPSDGWYNLAGGNPKIELMYKGFMPQPVAVTKLPQYTQTSGFTLEWDIPQYYAKGIEGFTIDKLRVKQGEWGTQSANITTPNEDWKTEMDCGISGDTIKFSASWNPAASITSEAYIATPSTNLSYFRKIRGYNYSSVLYTEIETDNSGVWTKINEDRFTEIEKTVNLSLAQYAGKSIKIRFSRFTGNGYFYTVDVSNLLLSNVRTVDWTIIADNLPASTKSYQVNNLTAGKKYQFRMESKLNNQWYASPIIDEVSIVEAEDQAPVINTENNQTEFSLDYTDCSIPLEISDDKTSSDQLEVKAFYCSRPDVFNASLSRFIPVGNGKGILKLYPRTRAGNTLLGIMVKDAAGNITKKVISVELKEGSIPEPTATSYYVTLTGSGDYSGTSWENASSDLTVMLDLADRTVSETKPTIYVASGTYYGNFVMAEGVNVYGGYDPNTNKQDLNNKSVIDGNRIRILTQPQEFTTPTTWSGFEFVNGGTGKTDSGLGSAVLLRAGGIINQCSMHDNFINAAVYCDKGGTVMNSVIYKNKDNLVVSGLHLNDGTAKAINCVIANNGGTQAISATGTSSIENCIVWENLVQISDTATCSYSAFPTQITGDGNIVLNTKNDAPNGPNFADPDNGNYALLSTSPCVNKGNNALNHSEFDFAGKPRIQFQTVDMGACELQDVTIPAGKTVNLDTYTTNNVLDGDLILYNTGSAAYDSDVTVNGKISFIRSFDSSEKWYSMVCPYDATIYIDDAPATDTQYELKKQTGSSLVWETGDQIIKDQPFLIKIAPELIGKTIVFVSATGQTIKNLITPTQAPTEDNAYLLCGSASLKPLTVSEGVILLPNESNPELFNRTLEKEATISPFNAYISASSNNKAESVNIDGTIVERIFTYYVTPEGAGDKTGTSWANATNDLQQAIENAAKYATRIGYVPDVRVASGTFHGGFTMVEGIHVKGGYNPETDTQELSNKTILNGDNITRVLTQPEAFTQPTRWSGFEITGGKTAPGNDGAGASIYTNGVIDQCYIHHNQSAQHGGGVVLHGGTVMNSVIVNNQCGYIYFGAGIFMAATDNKVINCTIANNTMDHGGGVTIWGGSIENSIIWNDHLVTANTFTISNTAYRHEIAGTGNKIISSDNNAVNGPNFADPDKDNYALLSTSPCVNKGNNALNHSEFDFAGKPRIQFQTVDMGACELQDVTIPAGKTINLDTYTTNNVLDGDLILYNTGSADYASDVIVNGKISFIRSFDSSEKWYSMVCPYAPTLYTEDTAIAADKFQLRKQTGERIAWEDISNIQEGQPFLIKVASELVGKELSFVSQTGLTISANPVIADVPANQEAFLLCGSASLKSMTVEQGKRFLPRGEDPEWFQRTFTEQTSIAPFNTYLLANTENTAYLVNIDGTVKEQILDLYVTPTGAGNKSGSSWKNASNDLQEAMNQAAQVISTTGYKSKVFVSSGTFTGNFKMMDGVNVHGGYNVETGLQDFNQKTVLNGNGTRTLTQSNKFSTATTWENFEITNGGKGPEGNTWNFGGGVLLYENGIIDKCYIHGNLKGDQNTIHHGGGVCCHTGGIVMNSIITNNRSMSNGSGVFLHEGGGKAINCVIANNSGAGNGGATIWRGSLLNSIVWNNGFLLDKGTILNSASDNTITGDTNILLNTDNDAPDGPNFTDWKNGDYTLKHTSICINKGNSDEVISNSDYAGNPRIRLGNVDMGAYEWQKSYLYNAETGEISLIEWTPSFDTDVKPEEVTSIDATGITVPESASLPEALSPNCLLYVSNAENTGSLKNVVVSDGQNGTAETIELRDGYPFYNTKNITTGSISYSRNFLDGWNTIALPFGLSTVGEDTIEEFNTVTGDVAKFTKVTTTEANTAYLIKIAEACDKVFSATGDVKVPPTASTGAVFKSTFKKLTGDAIAGKYILSIQNGKETFAKASSQAGSMPFRGYLELSGGLDSRLKVIHNDGGATNLHETDGGASLIIYSANGVLTIISDKMQSIQLYSIDGRVIRNIALQTGINTVEGLAKGIYLINNQKVAIK